MSPAIRSHQRPVEFFTATIRNNFTDRKTAVARIWKAVQALTPPPRNTRPLPSRKRPSRRTDARGPKGGARAAKSESGERAYVLRTK